MNTEYNIKETNKVGKVFVYVFLLLWTFINIFPIYWMFTFSLKNNKEIFGENVVGLPSEWLWSNYQKAMSSGDMGRYFINSIINRN